MAGTSSVASVSPIVPGILMELTGNDSIFARRLYPESETSASTSVQAEADTKHSEDIRRSARAPSTEQWGTDSPDSVGKSVGVSVGKSVGVLYSVLLAAQAECLADGKTAPTPTEPCESKTVVAITATEAGEALLQLSPAKLVKGMRELFPKLLEELGNPALAGGVLKLLRKVSSKEIKEVLSPLIDLYRCTHSGPDLCSP